MSGVETPAPRATKPSATPHPRSVLQWLGIAVLIGSTAGVACGTWLGVALADVIVGERAVRGYEFRSMDTVTSLDGRHVAIVASRYVGNSLEEAVAIRDTESPACWHVPFAWNDLSIQNVGWLDDSTLQITGYERRRETAREPVVLDELGITVVCRVLTRPEGGPR